MFSTARWTTPVPFQNDTSLFFHLDGYYQSSTLDTADSAAIGINTVDYPGEPRILRQDAGLCAVQRLGHLHLRQMGSHRLWSRNIFDADPRISGIYTEAHMGTSAAAELLRQCLKEAIYALPRTFGVTLNYKF